MYSYQELKSLTKKELVKELEIAEQDMIRIRISVKTKHHKDTSLVHKGKKYVAQLKTLLKEIELEELIASSVKIK